MAYFGSQRKSWATISVKSIAILLVALMFLMLCGHASQAALSGVEVLYTDSQAAILKVDPASAGPIMVAHGERLVQPLGIAVGKGGEIFVTDTGCSSVLELNLKNGKQRLVAAGEILGVPFGIAVEPSGSLLIANSQALIRVDPKTGEKSIASSGQLFTAPIAVAVAEDGGIYVVDAPGAVIRVDPANGRQTLVTSGN